MTALRSIPHRSVRTRRVGFTYPAETMDRHYVDGDLVMSHVVAMLSAMFPEGEDFFVRSVRRAKDSVTDSELAEQVAGFIGQEVTHGREHRALNERLAEMGYPTRGMDRIVHYSMVWRDKHLPMRFNLAVTAALEHYTATIAERLLRDERCQALLGDSEVRNMLLWHALEESEHKAVAFEVFQAAGGSERMRIRTFRLVSVLFVAVIIISTTVSLAGDRAAYHPVRLARSLAALRHSPFLSRSVVANLRAYARPGFHPDDMDATDLLDRWRAELFGADGRLAGHLR